MFAHAHIKFVKIHCFVDFKWPSDLYTLGPTKLSQYFGQRIQGLIHHSLLLLQVWVGETVLSLGLQANSAQGCSQVCSYLGDSSYRKDSGDLREELKGRRN